MLLTGKFGAVLASIPLPIVAALYCVLFAYVGMYSSVTNREYNWLKNSNVLSSLAYLVDQFLLNDDNIVFL